MLTPATLLDLLLLPSFLLALGAWAVDHIECIRAAQARFDAIADAA